MILLDVSNIMHTGASGRAYNYNKGMITLKSIPYMLHRIAAAYRTDPNIIPVFDAVGSSNALSSTKGYKAGRVRNPAVAWEIKLLEELFARYKIAHLREYQQEADSVINNVCRQLKGKQDVYILSADADLYSNVYDDGYTKCETLSFSTMSYSVNKDNFQETTGIEYNFVDLNKILKGCKSDNIKAFPDGGRIYDEYIRYVKSTLKRSAGFKEGFMDFSDLDDSDVLPLAKYERFIEWLETRDYFNSEMLRELDNRRLLVQGPQFDVNIGGTIDWENFNRLVVDINLTGMALVQTESYPDFNLDRFNSLIQLMMKVSENSASAFEPTLNDGREIETVSIFDLVAALNEEGEQ